MSGIVVENQLNHELVERNAKIHDMQWVVGELWKRHHRRHWFNVISSNT